MKKKYFLIFLMILICVTPVRAGADSIVLKDGKTIKADAVWEENDFVKCEISGSVLIYPKEDVAEIHSDSRQTENAPKDRADQLRQLKEKYTTHNAVLISTDGVRVRTLETWVENDGRVACKTTSGVSYIAPERIAGFTNETASDSIQSGSPENLTDKKTLPALPDEKTFSHPAKSGTDRAAESKDNTADIDNPPFKEGGKYWEAYYNALIAVEKKDDKAYADQMAAMEKIK